MPLTRAQADAILTEYLGRQTRDKFQQRQLREKPVVYFMDLDPSANAVIESISRVVHFKAEPNPALAPAADSPPRFAYFVDDEPSANWEHPCRYILVHEDNGVSVAQETAPPSNRNNAAMIEMRIEKI